MIKAIILDFDGVIVDSEPIHMLTFQELLGPLGVKIEKKRWYREFVGTGWRTIMKRLFDEFNIKEDADAYVARRKQLFASYVEKGAVKPVNGIAEFLKIAREKNLKLAIASGSHKNSIVQLLKMFGLESFFDAVVGAEDTVRKKPDPEPFLTAAKKWFWVRLFPHSVLSTNYCIKKSLTQNHFLLLRKNLIFRLQIVW